MAERWIFTKEQLQNTPSRKGGIDYAKELAYRQQAANLIQDMGQRLQVNQLCINTAIVYMHRFYMFQSFTRFHRNVIAPACLFLAAKVEEQLRKLEHVIKVARTCLNRESPPVDTKSEAYLEQAQELVVNENILLQSLGFDIQVDHPHTHVVKTCQLVRASKDLAQTSYFLATNSLHLTTMCLQYKPTIVACVCIHLASKWSEYEIAVSHEGKQWYSYVDKSVTSQLLAGLTKEFLDILESCPLRLKRKILTWKSGNRGEEESGPPEKRHKGESSGSSMSSSHPGMSTGSHDRHAGESSRSDRKSESVSKSHRSETVTLSGNDPGPVKQEDDSSLRHTNTQSVPTPMRKSASDISASSSKSFGQSGSMISQTSSSVDSVDGQKKGLETQQKSISVKDYKSYRENREREKQAAATATGSGQSSASHSLPQGERKPHSMPGSDSHRKHRHQHGSSSSGDEKKSRREHEKRAPLPGEEGGRQSEEPLKVHIKKERTDESLKVHIKKESGTHKIKPTDSPLKLKIKTLPGSETSPSKSHDKASSEHRPESLKMKLSLKSGQSGGNGERPSKHRRSESYSSHTSGTNPASSEMHNIQSNKHSHSSRSSTIGVEGNGVHDSGRSNSRHSNSHHKGAEHHPRAGQPSTGHQANMSFPTERGASGSIFSPPPVHQNFDSNIFDTGAMLLSQATAGGQRGNPNMAAAGYGGYHQQSNMSSNFNNSYSNYYPDMFNVGDAGQQLSGMETNGSGMGQQSMNLTTKEGLQQLQTNMQQLIGQTKSQIARTLQMQQQHGQAAPPYGMQAFMPGYGSNPPLPRVPPPPPPPPEDPPQPPPPPPSN